MAHYKNGGSPLSTLTFWEGEQFGSAMMTAPILMPLLHVGVISSTTPSATR